MPSGNGFPGGGPDFYTAAGFGNRSVAGAATMNNNPSQPPFRSRNGIFIDPSYQIANRTSSLIGKRTLSEFQAQQQQNQLMNSIFLRSVNPRLYNQTSPVFRSQPIAAFGNGVFLSGDPVSKTCQNGIVLGRESEKKMMNRLQELEKQLLNDEDDEESDSVSVIPNSNCEWSEAIQNLISSPSSSSAMSSASGCSKQSIMEAATAISEGKTELASEIVTRLTQFANAKGNSEQRLTGYMISALKSRLNPIDYPPPTAALYSEEDTVSTQMLYDLSPCFKLGFMAANLAIIEATLGCQKFHVIDFDIGKGSQYMNLLLELSSRQNGSPVTVKITAVDDSVNNDKERLNSIGDMLKQVAERVGMSIQFNVVTQKLTELTRDSLGCEPDETIAVNFAFKLYRMPDESVSTENPRDELLRRVKGLSPRVVTLVEQEMNTNTAPFTARVGETCSYYGSLFYSVDSSVARDNSDRVKVEECLSRKLVNSVACEGRDRVERCEVFGKWRARMGMAGFQLKPLSQNIAESMRVRLSSQNLVNPGFTVKEENGGVCFGWMGRTLIVLSAWH